MKVSVIICTYNRPIFLKSAIESVLSNTYPDFDLTIVDQSENDKSKNLVNEYAKYDNRIKYLHSEKGKSRALNLGIKETKGEIIALTDDDCIVPQDWIEKIVSAFELHPDVAIAFGDVLKKEIDSLNEYVFIPYHYAKERIYSRAYSMRKGTGMGANMSIKRWVFEKVGYFDESMGPGSHLGPSDDWDFAYRTLANGYSIYDTNLVKVQHSGARNAKEIRKLFRCYQISRTASLIKNLRCGDFTAVLILICTTWQRFYRWVWSAKFTPESRSIPEILKNKLDKCLYCLVGGFYIFLLWTFIGILKSFKFSVDKNKRLFIKK